MESDSSLLVKELMDSGLIASFLEIIFFTFCAKLCRCILASLPLSSSKSPIMRTDFQLFMDSISSRYSSNEGPLKLKIFLKLNK